MSGTSNKFGGSKDTSQPGPSHAQQEFCQEQNMLPVAPQELGIASSNVNLGRQRQGGRGQRGKMPLPPTMELTQSQQVEHLQQLGGYHQHPPFPWYQHQAGHLPQGQLPTGQIAPYSWLPYNVGYQLYGEQLGQPAFFPEGSLQGHTAYHLLAQGQELPNFHLTGPAQGFQQSAPGANLFSQVVQIPLGRGRPPRSSKPADAAPEAFDFDLAEARDTPDVARKTLMLRNIPNKYTIHMLLEMLDKCHKKSKSELVYDFCYLPIDFKNRCNLGYAFVNFVHAAAAADCFSAFHSKRWNDFNSKKVCEVKYARVQGKEALIEHFKNSKFPTNDIDCLPLLFEKETNEAGEEIVKAVPLHSRPNP